MPFTHAMSTVEDLSRIYRAPARPSVAKEVDHLDDHCRALIAHSTFMVMATADAQGRCDVSPKGGPPGFVTVLDDHRLAIPDLAGNNRLDSLTNFFDNPGVALLFCIPGLEETLRVNGVATITVDPEVLDAAEAHGIRPRVVIGVDVVTAFIHCAKALRRGSVWEPEGWPDISDLPTVACMLHDHMELPDFDLAAVEQRIQTSFEHLWAAGGQDRP